ncbi:MAG: hypothetical protein P8P74_03600 [Crocinitomicaceae bacterium]|nr:hypothetical protein [Crocinitomicaceae bacterium]
MKVSGKIAVGIIFIGIIMWNFSPVYAQVMTFQFHPDGTITNEHVGTKGSSFERYDAQMRIVEASHYFPGGKRMRMFNKFRYDNNMLAEEIKYIYTQGYERETFQYNKYGYETESRHYKSQTEGNWVEDRYMIQGYDERNNRNYFRVKGTAYGNVNSMSRTNYDYDNRTSTGIEYEFDANDREISSQSFRRGMADWQFERAGEYVFDIDKDGTNIRGNRVINWTGTDYHGNRVEKVFMNHDIFSRTIDQNNRIIRIELGSPNYDDNHNLMYNYNEVIDFKYDRQGRLIETISKHYRENEEKWVYKHGAKVEAKHYRKSSRGGWKLLKTKSFNNIDLFTPKYGAVASHSSEMASSAHQQEVGSAMSQAPPAQHSTFSEVKPSSSNSLVNDLSKLDIESTESENLSAFSLDADRLSHIAEVLSHATGVKVSEEQVLGLAMQVLIENYNADLREMNNDYLKDKVSVFD